MLDIFRSLKSLIKISHIHTDSAVFRLHYSLTVILLIAFSLIVTTRQYVGNPIDCIHSKDLPEDVLNTYCWIHSTYTITAAYRKKEGSEVPFPGIDNSKSYPESERKEYRYYQWVCFMLFLQAILFYTPRWLWKGWEGGKIHALMMDLDIGLCSEVEKKQKKKMLLDYLWENLRFHNWWAYRYYLCEVLALLNVIDVSDESLLRRRLLDLRHRRTQIPRIRSRRPSGPDDLRLSTYDQMHFLQVRRQRGGREARRRLYTASKRRQREDLCFSLVLVPFPRRAQFLYSFVQDHNNIFAAHEGLPVANEISFGTEGRCGDDSASQQGRRLVSPLHARREFGHRDIQRCDARFGEQTRLEASAWRTGSEGRATRSLIEVASEGRHARFAVVVVVVVAIPSSSIVRIARFSTHPREMQGARSQPELERTTDGRTLLEDPRRWIRSREDVSRLSFPPAVAHRTRSDATAIAPDERRCRLLPLPYSHPPFILNPFIILVYTRG
ncbi:uncharacterized protein LOC126855791 isoform X2 [Cataglyphis hispanica]|uniref:uncharacterized protein LOC126855791 isoform X2 n=1 Tax=Cataglyphis hispanica TaxID=1086592 RepID=UPI00218093D4|nr:uncharacterized protein LOC126855791 isoform X2 [Cataglyphis hispanica]XP_050459719.1 uncharacterized protein LOC126855791 isoform X2 [Cataglyphis hispanica]XP_050459729.1 uncharacterized protein LOC126855791 isoform X2 [Cataglyphis hispanica]